MNASLKWLLPFHKHVWSARMHLIGRRNTSHSFWTWESENSSMSSVSVLDYSSLSLWIVITSLLHHKLNHMTVKLLHSIHLMKRTGIGNSNNVVREGVLVMSKYRKPYCSWNKKTSFPAENLLAFVGICAEVKCICSSTTQSYTALLSPCFNVKLVLILVMKHLCNPLFLSGRIYFSHARNIGGYV